MTADEQQRLLQQFYDDLDDDTFLCNLFEAENNPKSDSDKSPVESNGPIESEIDMELDENVSVYDIRGRFMISRAP